MNIKYMTFLSINLRGDKVPWVCKNKPTTLRPAGMTEKIVVGSCARSTLFPSVCDPLMHEIIVGDCLLGS